MAQADEFVKDFLEHYSSPYYDPVKAHEYYVRTRQLKGRRLGFRDHKKKEAWAYAQNQISQAKKRDVKNLSSSKVSSNKQTHDAAAAHRQAIADKVKQLIASLPPVPKGLSKEDRANLSADRAAKIDAARNDAINQRNQIVGEVKAAVTAAQANYKKMRDQLDKKYEAITQKEYQNIKAKV